MKRCKQAQSKTKASVEVVDIEDISFSEKEISKIRASLLEWYDENRRDLPWRRISNGNNDDVGSEEGERIAYAVWVSEEVNEMWAGLGYYRRARFLLEGAKMIAEGGGEFPKTASSLQMVKGIGNYTAGAIASIAFKEAVPVVDGNVVRVITRLKAISANPKVSTTVKNIWELARQLVDPSRPGDFNQAVMELGATVCSVTAPSCTSCPISPQCQALSLSTTHESVQVTDYPMKVAKAQKRHDFSAVSVVEIIEEDKSQSASRYLLVKRPDEGLLAGLWEFPSVLLEGEADLVSRRRAIDSFLKESFDLDLENSCKVVLREEVGVYVHVFSHIRLKMYVELLILRLTGGENFLPRKQTGKTMTWKSVDHEALSTLGLTSGVRKKCFIVKKASSFCWKAQVKKDRHYLVCFMLPCDFATKMYVPRRKYSLVRLLVD
ncbi:hypothetical protein BUALT_Bualt02G0165000 [Buddleja alternifolia]|uniref:Adenine DNA glycosylase n=1 Tax=Buddleja alternifolia TaxID=168488 RepID=A0AAV6Y8R4_9LAMI|nr:hypothetical protein BUALT_Bualt02G0165000 [Buddleja alternifolia]